MHGKWVECGEVRINIGLDREIIGEFVRKSYYGAG